MGRSPCTAPPPPLSPRVEAPINFYWMRLCIHEADETLLEPGLKGHFKEILHYSFFRSNGLTYKSLIDSPVTITLVSGESSELVNEFVHSKKQLIMGQERSNIWGQHEITNFTWHSQKLETWSFIFVYTRDEWKKEECCNLIWWYLSWPLWKSFIFNET